jgi:two-component system sensor histidine kinase UhpB
MSLRIRLSLIVSMLFLAGMLLGSSFLISNARQRVNEEVAAAAALTFQLLNAVLLDASTATGHEDHTQLLARLRSMEDVRHLDIFIAGTQGEAGAPLAEATTRAPAWFVYLVQAPPLEYTVPLAGNSGEHIVIRTRAADEIAEVWLETRNFIVVLLVVLLLLNGLLYFILGRWLAPVSAIVAGLEDAEHGNFSGHLSQASLPELKVIVEKLNQLTAVLRTSKAENDRLTRRALVIREDERRHLARELHDELGQSISAIKAIAFSIAQRMQGVDAMSAEGAGRIGTISGHVSGHVRSMMGRLRPAILDELGLVPALQVMVDEWNRDHRETFCSLRVSGTFDALDPDRQISAYRIIQEALTNVARHAAAERVEVNLAQENGNYQLTVSDDGRGFDPAMVEQGMGLSGIRERCQALTGTLRLAAAPGKGVQLTIDFSGDRQVS